MIAPDLYRDGGLLMYWTHELNAPWQTEAWREQMRGTLRPNQYLRLIENRWVTTECSFVPMEWWDRASRSTGPLVAQRDLAVWVGVDAGVKQIQQRSWRAASIPRRSGCD